MNLTGIDAATAELASALDEECLRGGVEAAGVVADEARRSHPYENRTGQLEARTVPGRVRGRVSADTLRIQVVGETRYGGYLEEGTTRLGQRFVFLRPAYARAEDRVVRAIEDSMTRAAERAGWK